MTDHEENLRQCLWLSELIRQSGLNSKTIKRLLMTWPDLPSLMKVSPVSLAEAVQGPPDRIRRILNGLKEKNWLDSLEDQAIKAAKSGIRSILINQENFPERLKEISGCPLVLYYRGEKYLEIMKQPYFVTIIGTRTPTAYGRTVTEQITADLAKSQVVVISGLARGIDGIAHRAALKANGMTIAVVGNGPDRPYPPEHADLMTKIAQEGLIISEHPPGTPPRRQHFPARNRILSGLADAVAVIEASSDSGTMITASFAGDQGRDVFAVPGSILSPFSQGCNQLIRDGAAVLESAQDLLWRLPVGIIQTQMEQTIRQHLTAENDPDEGLWHLKDKNSQLKQLLLGCPLTLAEIASEMNLPIEEIAALLTFHEMDGRIQCERGRYSLTEKAVFCI